MGETAANLRRVTSSTTLPVIADADTGYGDERAVAHAVAELERAGASAIQIEDQVWPKRCGHMAGKQVIAADEMVLKVRAACAAARPRDGDHRPHGRAATSRARRGALALPRLRGRGRRLVFVDAPQDREQLRAAATQGGAPGVANMVETGVTPLLPVAELQQLGFALVIFPATHVWAFAGQYSRLCRAILDDGTTEALRDELLPSPRRTPCSGCEQPVG